MAKKRTHLFVLAFVLGLGMILTVLMLPGEQARAGDPGEGNPSPSLASPSVFAASTAMDGGGLDVSGSSVEPVGYSCYEPGVTQTLCFNVYNGSVDGEWLDGITMTFPAGPPLWDASCGPWDSVDSSGSPVNFTCGWMTPGNDVFFIDNDIETPNPIGEISAGSSWGFCVQVDIPAGYAGPQPISWEISGDGDGTPPHSTLGEVMIEECMPIMLNPSSMPVEGCNGVTQTLTFELWNHHAGAGTFDLGYHVPSGNAAFDGPSGFYLTNGGVVTFTVELAPDRCLEPGAQVTALIEVLGNGEGDSSLIEHTVSSLAGWQIQPYASPVPSMDSVVVWASHDDGGLWVIGGYGSGGATQRYDPGSDTWTTHTSEATITPTIEYPMDGCYGLNGDGDEVVVLFPDTIVTGSLHIYNVSHDFWYTETTPVWYPAEGRWGQEIVSLLNTPGVNQNVCYLSGGATRPGGGQTRDLWVYYPANPGSGSYLGNFPDSHPFNFHASWYVPWVGTQGSICVAGGIDFNSQINDATQCYDLATSSFRTPNADLGPLPEPWWGMADGWQMYQGQYQIWMANGVAQDGSLLPISVYASATSGGFQPGPDVPIALYRGEGDGWVDSFYMIDGSIGGFGYSFHNQLLVRCPWCSEIFIPLALRNH